MQIEKKYWTDMLDADSADFRVQQNAYINLKDFRFGPTSDKGFSEQLEAIGGTIAIANSNLPSGQNWCIGVAEDYSNRRQVYFNWNENGNHGIYCYDYFYKRIDPVLLASDSSEALNFDKSHLIHSARVENGCVYWTDNLNQPRRININAGIEMHLTAANIFGRYVKNTTTFLPVDNSDPLHGGSPGNLIFTFYIPPNPIPSYANGGLAINMVAVGNDGTPLTLAIPLNWSNYPTETPEQIIVDGIFAILTPRGLHPADWQCLTGNGFVTLYLRSTWDFGTGDPFWTSTASVNLQMQNYVYTNGSTPNPYVSPVNESVIAWIRRQPGLPPTFLKVTQTSPALSSNLVAQDAMQFAYRYVYHDGEVSTLSADSALANFNADAETSNRIDVALPLAESIAQDVIQIDLVCRYLVSGIFFIIHSWRKATPTDAIAIDAHNSGTAALSYSFYNDVAGIALDTAYSNKEADSVPLLAQTIEMAKQRAFMGNYTAGYNTPTRTSLNITTGQITLTTSGGTTITGEWFFLQWSTFGTPHSAYVLVTTSRVNSSDPLGANYYYTYSGTVPPFPGFVNASQLTFRGNTAAGAASAIQGAPVNFATQTDQGAASVINIGSPPATGAVLAKVFKSFASYQVGVHFRDRYGRPCGELTLPSLTVNTPDVFSGGTINYNYVNAINWNLDETNAVLEIPVEAWYYSIDVTLCLRTRFFVQGVGLIVYAARDTSNNYTFTTTAYASTLAGVAIDITGLQSYGQGYVFSQGDAVRVYVNNSYFTLSVIGQSAQYIICQLQNVGTLSTATCHFEIFTPYQRQTNEPFYEVADLFPVLNPGTGFRLYSNIHGTISGDVYVFSRGGYLTEGMNITDKHYTNWYTDAGRPNFIDYIGQVTHLSTVAWSNTFIAGTQNNGLSTFDALDTQDISPDFGPIQKLQLASKVSKIGTVMLAICAGPATASLYLGENTLISQTGDSVVAQANTVIGSVHELKGAFGTLNPESVVELRGSIYWFDVQNGMIIQYADNGLFPISNYKMSRYWKLFADTYTATPAGDIDHRGDRPFIFGCADPHHGEILFSVPKLLDLPPNGVLPDYPTIDYPFDIWDGQGKTLVYKLYTDPNHWQGSISFSPDYMFYLEDNFFSFKNGVLYIHNQTNYCNYYGVQNNPAVMGVGNQQTARVKIWNNFAAQANAIPSLVYFMSLYPYEQRSDLLNYNFKNLEGQFYAPILRNKEDPAVATSGQGLLAGEKMRTASLYYMCQWTGGGLVQVQFLNIGYQLSLGQKT